MGGDVREEGVLRGGESFNYMHFGVSVVSTYAYSYICTYMSGRAVLCVFAADHDMG